MTKDIRWAWLFVFVITLIRLFLIGTVSLGDDEAYYWDWSRRLDWSYYDHPPMVAWLIGTSTSFLGDTAFAVRLPFVLLSVLGGALVCSLSLRLYPGQTTLAALAMCAFHSLPIMSLAAVFAAPDMPMVVCWLGLTTLGLKAFQNGRWIDWVVAGIVAGLGLLSKYTMVLSVVGLFGWLLTSTRGRQQLGSKGPWLGAGVAGLVFSPVLFWNAERGWISFAFHLSGRHGHEVDPLTQAVAFVGSQLLAASPVLCVVCVLSLWKPKAGLNSGVRLILWQAMPVLLLFSLTSPFTSFKAHWPAPAWALSLPLALGWLCAKERVKLWLFLTMGLSALLSGVILSQAVVSWLPVDQRTDPTNDLVGWNQVSQAVEQRCGDEPDCVVLTHMYQLAAQAAFAMPDRTILRLGERVDQYSIWQDEERDPTTGIWVAHDRYAFDPTGGSDGVECIADGELPVSRAGQVVRTFYFWRCTLK